MQAALQELLGFQLESEWIDGDFTYIWKERAWHPDTRAEIYQLIWTSRQLGFTLPVLVLDRIAFWIQLIELCKDLRSGELLLQADFSKNIKWYRALPMRYLADRQMPLSLDCFCRTNGKLILQHLWPGFTVDSLLFARLDNDDRNEENALKMLHVKHYIKKKDHYRIIIPYRDYLEEWLYWNEIGWPIEQEEHWAKFNSSLFD